MKETEEAPRWIRPLEFAKRTGIHWRTVYRWVDTGEIHGAVKVGRAVFIPASEVTELFERGKMAA